jgi:hypothetical protein
VGWNLLFQKLFYLTHEGKISMCGKRESDSLCAGAARPSNSMDVVFRRHWKIEVDHMADRLYVEASSSHICCNEHANLSGTHLPHSASAHTLVHVPVKGGSLMADFAKPAGEIICMPFCGNEDNGLLEVRVR